jgi:uncharacterized membrane protein (UPF0127 family)
MTLVQVLNVTRGSVLGARVEVADRWWLRLRGLYGRPPLVPGEGLLSLPCSRVRVRGASRPVDVALLAGDGEVVAVYHSLPPGGYTHRHARARSALLLPAGMLRGSGTREGDLVAWSEWTAAFARWRARPRARVHRLAFGAGRSLPPGGVVTRSRASRVRRRRLRVLAGSALVLLRALAGDAPQGFEQRLARPRGAAAVLLAARAGAESVSRAVRGLAGVAG